ncbi:MAG: endo-1,4-beta-xylanase [Prevotella sp.]|nr:endo-1,4-beta-xylanase [Prevotella sp.]
MKNKTVNRILFLCIVTACFHTVAPAKKTYEFEYLYRELPFEMSAVQRPSIPRYSVSLTDFGGRGDGMQLNTQAFADAISHLSERGGGHLVVPEGLWLTGPIGLESNIDLHVKPGAVIMMVADRTQYPIVEGDYGGKATLRHQSPIHARGKRNISITGGGIIDGNGDYWRMVKKDKMTPGQWNSIVASGGIVRGNTWYPTEELARGEDHRPDLVFLWDCENVLLEDCTFENSANWNVHPLLCSNMIIKNVTIRNPWYSCNGDALDLDCCRNVVLVGSSFDCGDDAICIKSGKDKPGRDRGVPCENILIDDCVVYHGHGGFTIGSEMSGGVRNIRMTNSRFIGTDVGLRFKSARGRGGIVENIWIDGLYMKDIAGDAVSFSLYYMDRAGMAMQAQPVDEGTPRFRDFHISRLMCNGAARAMEFMGLPEMPVKDIHISHCQITAHRGATLRYCEDITFSDTHVQARTGQAFTVSDSHGVTGIPVVDTLPSSRPLPTASLKEAYAGAFMMGCAINRSMAYEEDTAAVSLLLRQFNAISPESDLKPEHLHPTPASWTFEHADRYVSFAEQHQLAALGHTLVWHNQTPDWFWFRNDGTAKPRQWVLDNMENYVETVTAHFAGKVYAWDVINELLDEDGSYRTGKGWGKALAGDCDELVKRAFSSAHRGDSNAELYYNDYNLWRPSKLAGVVRMVRMLQAEGIRIDGVGIQAHWGLNYPDTALVAQAIDTLYALGVKVMFTELDVDVLPLSKEGQMSGSAMSDPVFQRDEFFRWLNPYPNGLPADVDRQLANRYGELFSLLYNHRDKIDRVTFWGLHDGVSWKNKYPVPNRTNYPLLFDRRLQPKSAYNTVIQIPRQ